MSDHLPALPSIPNTVTVDEVSRVHGYLVMLFPDARKRRDIITALLQIEEAEAHDAE